MTNKKSDVPGQGQSGKTTPKKEEVKKLLPAKSDSPTVEELQKKIDQLQGKLASMPKDLNSRIEYFSKKQELIRRLSKLNGNKENLELHLDNLSEISAKNEFETDDYFLSIESGKAYNKTEVFSVQNPVIIAEMINFIIGRIDAKRTELQKQIEA